LALILKLFGNSEIAGRSLAIILFLIGAIFIIMALPKKISFFAYFALPLIFLNPAGRDSIPFVFADATFFLFTGVAMFLVSKYDCQKIHKYLFRVTIFISVLFSQLIIPYFFIFIVAKYLKNRNKKEMIIDFLLLFLAGLLIIGCLSYNGSNFQNGFQGLFHQFLHRSSLDAQNAESISIIGLLKVLPFEVAMDFGLNVFGVIILIPLIFISWGVLVKKRDWLAASLLVAFLFFSMILRNYVGIHHFARLPLVFFFLITILMAIDYLLSDIKEKISKQSRLVILNIATTAILILLGITFSYVPQWYKLNINVNNTRNALIKINNNASNLAIIKNCNSFEFKYDDKKMTDPQDRVASFYFSQYVVQAINNGSTPQKCLVNLNNNTVSLIK